MPLREDAATIAGDLAKLRHAIHREPEIGLNLPRTQEKVLAALDGLPLEITTGKTLSSVTAVLRGESPKASADGARPSVLLRRPRRSPSCSRTIHPPGPVQAPLRGSTTRRWPTAPALYAELAMRRLAAP